MLTLWITVLLFESVLCCLLWLLRIDRTYPAFTYFITFQIVESLSLFALRDDPAAFFYTFWMMTAADSIFKLGIVIELFHSVYRKDLIEREVVRRFYMLVVIIGMLSFALAFRFPSQYPVRLLAVIRTAELGANLTVCVAFVALLAGAWWEGLYWMNRARGIGYGLMLYLPLRVVIAAISSSAWRRTITVLNWVDLFGFLGAVLTWIVFFARPEVTRAKVSVAQLRNRIRELSQSNGTEVFR
jgi:hypothetical protein